MHENLFNSSQENRDEKNIKKKNFNFNQKKENAIKSLKEVECFLRSTNKITEYLKLYKTLKK